LGESADKSATASAFSEDRRSRKPPPVPADSGSPPGRFASYWAYFRLDDIVSARHHSDDFVETRAEYIALRLRFMAIFFALAVPLWIPIDFVTIRPEHFTPMVAARLLLAATLLPIGLLTLRKLSSRQTHALLSLAIIAPTVFFVASIAILNLPVAETPLIGYSFMPFVIVSMLGLFPLTLVFGLLLLAIVLALQLALTVYLEQLTCRNVFDTLWTFVMFSGVSLWIQSGQLLMLLKLYRESTLDPLTGLINRRVLMKRLAAETARNDDGQNAFCILMFDLDRFKRINDNYGHLTGDKVLTTTAQILKDGLRRHDIVARFGGEEFVAVLPNANGQHAVAIAERIREVCHNTRIAAPNNEIIELSTSVGVTEYETGEAIETALRRVDDCLYQAKELGRNRVVLGQSGHGGRAAVRT